MPWPIDERLFAHINTDAFLVGSYKLEGNQFVNTISFLTEFVAIYKADLAKRNMGELSPEVLRLFKACEGLVDYETSFKQNLDHAAQKIGEAIRKLETNPDDYVLIPGGWMDTKGGHAMIYQVRKNKDGDYLFCIHNSGAGLQYHAKRSGKDKEYYNPVLTYKIPKSEIGRPDLDAFIKELLKVQIASANKQSEIDASYLYEKTFPKLSYLKGKLVREKDITAQEGKESDDLIDDQDKQDIPYTAGQLSGTCSQHSLHQMLKSSFKDTDKYRDFIYRFKAYSLDRYMATLRQSGEINQIKKHGQIEKAIRHQLRLLNSNKVQNSDEALFPLDMKIKEKEKLDAYLSELSKIKSAVKKAKTPVLYNIASTRINMYLGSPDPVISGQIRASDISLYPEPHTISHINELDKILKYCLDLKAISNNQALFEQIEHLLSHMPLPGSLDAPLLPFYNGLVTEADSIAFYKKMAQLQRLYYDSAAILLGKGVTIPRMHITRLNILAITRHVNKQFPLVSIMDVPVPYGDFTDGMSREVTAQSPHSPYLATDHLELDERYIRLRQLFKTKNNGYNNQAAFNYYRALVDRYPSLVNKLNELYFARYREDESEFHQYIQKNDFGYLYYLFTVLQEKDAVVPESLLNEPEYIEWVKKDQEQTALEILYGFADDKKATMKFSKDSIPEVISAFSQGKRPLTLAQLTEHKYGISRRSIPFRALDYAADLPSSNQIQAEPIRPVDSSYYYGGHFFETTQIQDRELLHLRKTPSTQISLTLDYFNIHPEKIANPEIRAYLEANLFESGLLKVQLSSDEKASQLFEQLSDLVKNGLKFYNKKGYFSQESLFYLRILCLVSSYANEINPHRFHDQLESVRNQLNTHLAFQKDSDIKTSLHRYRFLTYTSSPTALDDLKDPQKLGEALSSYFWGQVHDNAKIKFDNDERYQYLYAQHSFKRALVKSPNIFTQDTLLDVIQNFGISIDKAAKYTMGGNFPLFQLMRDNELVYQFDVVRGFLYKDGAAIAIAPINILNHPISKRFGLHNQALAFISPDENICTLDNPPNSLRFIKMSSGGYRVQKKWLNSNNVEQWYELISPNEAHLKYWSSGYFIKNSSFSQLMSQRDNLIWRSTTEAHSFLISDSANKVICDGDSFGISLRSKKSMKLCDKSSWMYLKLRDFESDSFINAWKDAADSCEISLERYGLKFTAGPEATIKWSWEGIDYELDETAKLFDSGIAHLLFKKGDQERCIIPIQPFVLHSSAALRAETHEYYKLDQDISGALPKAMYCTEKNTKEGQTWQYTNSERYMAFNMKDGEPVADNRKEALYLCYIYLGSNQPEKAWRVLDESDKRFGALDWNYEELQYLQWIISGLPYGIDDDDNTIMKPKASVDSPPFVACKLKALSLLTQCSKTGKKIIFPEADKVLSTADDVVKAKKIARVEAFYQQLPNQISALYKRLQPMRRELEAEYQLSDVEGRSLLDYYHRHSGSQALGALGYEWVQLNLNQLKRESGQLKAKQKTRVLTPAEQNRLQEIDKFISNHRTVAKTTSRLRYVEIPWPTYRVQSEYQNEALKKALEELESVATYKDSDCTFSEFSLDEFKKLRAFVSASWHPELTEENYKTFKLPIGELPDIKLRMQYVLNLDYKAQVYMLTNKLVYSSTEYNKDKAVKDLVLGVRAEIFVGNFKHYLAIVTTPGDLRLKQIMDFCSATVIGLRDTGSSNDNIKALCSILYRLGNANKPLPESDPTLFPIYSTDGKYSVIGGYGVRSYSNLTTYVEAQGRVPTVRSLSIPELADSTSDILAKPTEMWDLTPEFVTPVRPKKPIVPADAKVGEWLTDELKEFRIKWHELEQELYTGKPNDGIVEPLKPADKIGLDPSEARAGVVKFKALQKLQQLANDKITPAVFTEIKRLSSAKFTKLEEDQEDFLNDILEFANKGPDDPVEAVQWNLDRASGKRKTLKLNDLLRLYFHADSTQYALDTGLSVEQINQLHEVIARYVAQGIQKQHCERVNTQIEAVEKAASPADKANALYVLAQIMCAESLVDGATDPELNVFQFHTNLLLRQTQQDALKRLLQTKDTDPDQFFEAVEKIIMGGGKSKVILPTLAQKKATGYNLVIIEVPRALLHTNYTDLRSTSTLLYDQNAYLFEFNRDSDCSPQRLQDLFEQLNEVMVNKQYLVTTGDALQSLELKYLELLSSPPDSQSIRNGASLNDWKQQVAGLDRLVALFKERGDLIIDEAHQGLLLKNKLNYTFGDSSVVSKNIIKHSVDLYQFLAIVPIGASTLQQELVSRNRFIEEASITEAMEKLVHELVTSQNSPLSNTMNRWRSELGDEADKVPDLVKEYLLGQAKTIPDFILKANPEVQERIAFYKEQISNVLPFTLRRQQGEHYGPSKLESRQILERMVAIPYIANNVPSERSQFASFLESINYSIQSLLITGLSEELLSLVFKEWINQARIELLQTKGGDINETAIAALYRSIAGAKPAIPFSEIDDDHHLSQLHAEFGRHPALTLEILKSYVLPKIKIHDSILHSDAYSHVDMVRSCQCITGTPWNYSTFHQRLSLSTASALGTDGYVLKAIQEKKPIIRAIDFSSVTDFIAKLLDSYGAGDEVRAIIDINASFKGISNLDVVRGLAGYIQRNQVRFSNPDPVKFVLFFNEKNELSALSTQGDIENQEPIVIGSSDPKVINERLQCKPTQRFTFFDQSHTVGADIKQSTKSKAVVLIDEKTHFQNFLQGSMRMRDLLEGNQSMDVVVPTTLKNKNLEDLAQMMVASEQRQLKQDNYSAARAKMKNMIRNEFKQRILSISGADAIDIKHKFFKVVEKYFIDTESETFFERFGGVNGTENTESLLNKLKNALLDDWEHLLTGVSEVADEDRQKLSAAMQLIVNDACKEGVCEATQVTRKNSLEQQVEKQQEQEQQQEKEQETLIQKETYRELYNDYPSVEYYRNWGIFQGKITPEFIKNQDIRSLSTFEDIPAALKFSPDIKAGINFYRTIQPQLSSYYGQLAKNQSKNHLINLYMKPVHALMFVKKEKGFECILLSQEECNELFSQVDKVEDGSCWITTTQHTVLAGKSPENVKQDKQYQSIIEQVRFYNGEFGLLAHSDFDLNWLTEDSDKKIDFYIQRLRCYRETSETDLVQIRKMLSVNLKVIQRMLSKPWVNYSGVNWIIDFPAVQPEDAPIFESFAQALNKATLNWDKSIKADELATEFNLSFDSKGYLFRYIEQLEALNQLFQTIAEKIKAVREQGGKPPLNLFSGLDPTTRARLCSLCPALKTTYDEYEARKGDKQDYECLMTLMQTLPMCKKHPGIVQALAFNSKISEKQLEQFKDLASQDPVVLAGLLKNESELITSAEVEQLYRVKQDAFSIAALAGHDALPETLYLKVEKIAKELGPDAETRAGLELLKSRVDLHSFLEKKAALTKEQVEVILARKQRLSLEELGWIVENMPKNDADLSTRLEIRTVYENLALRIDKCEGFEQVMAVLEQHFGNYDSDDEEESEAEVPVKKKKDSEIEKQAKEESNFCISMALAGNITIDNDKELASCLAEDRILLCPIILRNHQEDKLKEKPLLLEALLKTEFEDYELETPYFNKEQYLLKLIRFNNSYLTRQILLRKTDDIDPKVVLNLLTDESIKLDDELFLAIGSGIQTSKEILLVIFKRMQNPNTISLCIDALKKRKDIGMKLFGDLELSQVILNNKNSEEQVFCEFAERTVFHELIKTFISVDPLSEKLALALIKNPILGKDTLLKLLQKTNSASVIAAILERKSINGEEDIDEALFAAMFAKKAIISLASLTEILARTRNKDTIHSLIVVLNEPRFAIEQCDAFILNVIKNPFTKLEDLKLLLAKPLNAACINELMARKIFNQPSEANDKFLKLLGNQILDTDQLETMSKLVFNDESIWQAILAKICPLTPSTLLAIASKTKDLKTINAILDRGEVQAAVKQKDKNSPYVELYVALIKNSPPGDFLLRIATTLFSPKIASELLDRPELKIKGKKSKDILIALVKNESACDATLIEKIVSCTDDQEVFQLLITTKFDLFNVKMLQELANKKGLTEATCLLIANHQSLKDPFASVAAADYQTTLDALDTLFSRIVNKTESSKSISALLAQSYSGELFTKKTGIAVIANDNTDDDCLIKIINDPRGEGLLQSIFDRKEITEPVLLALIKNCQEKQRPILEGIISQAMSEPIALALIENSLVEKEELFTILQKTNHPSVIDAILKRETITGAERIDEKLFAAMLAKSELISVESLTEILAKTHSAATIHSIVSLLGASPKLAKAKCDTLYLNGIKNPVTEPKDLILLVGRKLNPECLAAVFMRESLQSPNESNDKILKELLKHELDIGQLETVCKLIHKDETIWQTVLAKKGIKLSAETLVGIASRTKNPKTIQAILDRQEMKETLDERDTKSAYVKVQMSIAKNCPPGGVLVKFATTLFSSEVALALLARDDVSSSPEQHEEMFLALAKNTDSSSQQLVEQILNLSTNSDVLEALILNQEDYFTTLAMLQELANKPSLSEATHSLILAHKALGDPFKDIAEETERLDVLNAIDTLFSTIINKTKIPDKINALSQYSYFVQLLGSRKETGKALIANKHTNDDLLIQIIQNPKSEDLLAGILDRQNISERVYLELIKVGKEKLRPMLVKIASKIRDKASMDALLNLKMMNEPSDENDIILLALKNNRNLLDTDNRDKLLLLMEKANNLEQFKDVLDNSEFLSKPVLLKLVKAKKVGEENYNAIAKDHNSTPGLLEVVAQHASSEATFDNLLIRLDNLKKEQHTRELIYTQLLNNPKLSNKSLIHIAMNSTDKATLDKVFLKRNTLLEMALKNTLDLELVKNDESSIETLLKIASITESKEIFDAFLDHKRMKTPGVDNDRLLDVLLDKKFINTTEMLKALLSKAKRDDLYLAALSKKYQLMDNGLLAQVLSKFADLSPEQLTSISEHKKAEFGVLLNIAKRFPVPSAEIAASVLSFANGHKAINCDAIYSVLLKNKKLPDEVLIGIINNTQNGSIIEEILSNTDHREVLMAIVEKSSLNLSKDVLKKIVHKARDLQLLDEVLQRKEMRDFSEENEAVYLSIVENKECVINIDDSPTFIELMERVVAKIPSREVVGAILERDDLKNLGIESDSLWETLSENPNLHSEELSTLTERVVESETAWNNIAKNKLTPPASLLSIANQTTNPNTIFSLLNHPSLLEEQHQEIRHDIYVILAKSTNINPEGLLYIAKHAANILLINALIFRENLSQQIIISAAYQQIYSTLAVSEHLQPESIVQMCVITDKSPLLESLVAQKIQLFNERALEILAGKTGMSEVILLEIAKHDQSNNDSLCLVAEKTADLKVLSTLLDQVGKESKTRDERVKLLKAILKNSTVTPEIVKKIAAVYDYSEIVDEIIGFARKQYENTELPQDDICSVLCGKKEVSTENLGAMCALVSNDLKETMVQELFDKQGNTNLDRETIKLLASSGKTKIETLTQLTGKGDTEINQLILQNLFNRRGKGREEKELINRLISQVLLSKIELLNKAPKFGERDQLLEEYIASAKDKINTIEDKEGYEGLIAKLDTMYKKLDSPTTRALYNTIERLRLTVDKGPAFFLTKQKGSEKADKVAAAMMKVPLDQRDNILAPSPGDEVKKVQKALAKHRNWLSSLLAGESVNDEGELTSDVKPDSAAKAYKELKKEIENEELISSSKNPQKK